jgi:transcriptional regulator with XRE-family HTH domain
LTRQELGRKLLGLRRRAGLSGAALASRLGTTQSRISRIETGRSVPSLDDVRAWVEATNASQAELEELAGLLQHLAATATSWRILHRLGLTERQRELGELEREATMLCVFQPTMVPGLLQIAEYARRVMTQGNPSDQADIAAAVQRRLQRQTILYDQSKSFEFLLTETALRWRPGPLDMMRAQLDRLVSVASLPNVELGVIPLEGEAPDAYLHPFVIFELDDDPLVTVETYSAEMQVSDPQDVAVYRRTLDRLRPVARWAEDATQEIHAIVQHLPGLDHPR